MVIEKYYTVQQVAWLLEFDRKTIADWARDGRFGHGVLNVNGSDVRIPASGVNAYLVSQRVLLPDLDPVAARSEGELRRKLALVS